ncbi:class I SAM-dependent methyltransferase [Ileibacterium valens]|uniref:class I SAM-dependent methyltransferase n=1 Tax=Ileibacterium valens TaxID=1862668 RepID=UPI002353BE96|nr:methyltransferase [Ileibacterium valens]
MSHYYQEDLNVQSRPMQIHFELNQKSFELESDSGVFSSDKLDTGTRILLETVLEQSKPQKNVLDLGCGTGAVGVVLGMFWNSTITGVDTNARAARLAKKNYEHAKVDGTVVVQDGIQNLNEKFDCILLNPPIRTGKETIYRLFDEAVAHLTSDGKLWIVIRKQHGAASAVKYMEDQGYIVRRANRDKGFWILEVSR